MREKKLGVNSILNAIKAVMKIIFPLITYKYVSNILQVEDLGRYNFALSIVSYFSFIAALGVYAYSVRTGAVYRENRKLLEEFVGEVFTINVLSTILSYIFLGVFLVLVPGLDNCKNLIMILSLQILFNTIGVEWIFSIMEDYLSVTIRSVVIQVLALLLLLLFVKSSDDTNMYALVTVIAAAGSNLFNFFYASKYCRIRLSFDSNIRKHIVPILILFAQNLSILIYVNSDITFLGVLAGDYYVGVYSVATNIYKGIKTILSSLIMVSIPRLSYYWGKGEEKNFEELLERVFTTIMTCCFPIIAIIILLSKDIVLLLSSEAYLEAIPSVVLLCIATLFCVLSYIYGQCILIPMKKEKVLLQATLISALANVVLNIVFIPWLKHVGAAITTIISECIVFVFCWGKVHKTVRICKSWRNIMDPIVGGIVIIGVGLILKMIHMNYWIRLCITVSFSIVFYFLIELKLGNRLISEIYLQIKARIRG